MNPSGSLLSSNSVKQNIYSFLINLAALAIASVLFALSFPNLLFENGLPIFAWVAYVPVFWVIRRTSVRASFFWGALYGYAAYGLFNYWLSVFHPLAGLIVGSIYLVYMAVLFPLLKAAILLYPKRGYLLQWVMWIAFEYLRIQGFLGYAYGITGYSQWTWIPVIQIASVTGVWGVSALVVFSSSAIAAAIPIKKPAIGEKLSSAYWKECVFTFLQKEKIALGAWVVLLAAALIFGFAFQINYKDNPTAKLALIQHNTDPWRGGIDQYRHNYEVLKRLSDEALSDHPDLDLVVWSETAFVPRIYWHTTIRDDPASWVLVKELLDYLASTNVPFLIGNDDARREPDKNPRDDNRVDYNAAMLFENGVNTQMYRKLHLVPFTENFPYEKQLPWIYNALINADTHFWEKGNEAKVFELALKKTPGGVKKPDILKFSTPICFEDTFGYLSRDFVKNGAELIVNISNDAWSASLPAQNQHLSMAIFRAVENRRSMVRSTASGQTCGIDPNGRILAMAPPFSESALTVDVPIVTDSSIYTMYGDWLAWVFLTAAVVLLICGVIRVIIRKYVNPHHD
ncbi:MAG: apolipoprotein N-acyltransferase [Treponema sp.]|nr:apolipoprotein N-acyltransferase [Treponema sp.]